MHPNRELTKLAIHKAALRRSITRQREELVADVDAVVQPLRWADRWQNALRPLVRFAPLVLMALSLRRQRGRVARLSRTRYVLRWGRVVLLVARGLRALLASRQVAPAR